MDQRSVCNEAGFKRASVIDASPAETLVQISSSTDDPVRPAQPLRGVGPISTGDVVLVACDDEGGVYIVGVVATAHRTSEQDASTSSRHELVLEHDPISRRTRLRIPQGDLVLSTEDGDIIMDAARDVVVRGRVLSMQARRGTHLCVLDRIGRIASSITLFRRGVRTQSDRVEMTAQRAELNVDDTQLTGRSVRADVERADVRVGRLQMAADVMVSKARNAYWTVLELLQTRAGRSRTRVDGTSHSSAKRVYTRADDDYRLNGDKIHIG